MNQFVDDYLIIFATRSKSQKHPRNEQHLIINTVELHNTVVLQQQRQALLSGTPASSKIGFASSLTLTASLTDKQQQSEHLWQDSIQNEEISGWNPPISISSALIVALSIISFTTLSPASPIAPTAFSIGPTASSCPLLAFGPPGVVVPPPPLGACPVLPTAPAIFTSIENLTLQPDDTKQLFQ